MRGQRKNTSFLQLLLIPFIVDLKIKIRERRGGENICEFVCKRLYPPYEKRMSVKQGEN